MIAREEELIFVEQDHVPARVAGHGDDNQIIIEMHCVFAFDDAFDTVTRRAVCGVHDTRGSEFFGEGFVVCDVVAVCEKNCADAAHRFDLFDQWSAEARRVNEHVAAFRFGAHD